MLTRVLYVSLVFAAAGLGYALGMSGQDIGLASGDVMIKSPGGFPATTDRVRVDVPSGNVSSLQGGETSGFTIVSGSSTISASAAVADALQRMNALVEQKPGYEAISIGIGEHFNFKTDQPQYDVVVLMKRLPVPPPPSSR